MKSWNRPSNITVKANQLSFHDKALKNSANQLSLHDKALKNSVAICCKACSANNVRHKTSISDVMGCKASSADSKVPLSGCRKKSEVMEIREKSEEMDNRHMAAVQDIEDKIMEGASSYLSSKSKVRAYCLLFCCFVLGDGFALGC